MHSTGRFASPIAAAVVLWASLGAPGRAGAGTGDRAEDALREGAPAPHFALPTLNPAAGGRESVATKQLVGEAADDPRRALVLSFAASYCAPCRQELPELKELAARHAGAGVLVVVVAIDRDEAGQEAMRRLLVDELQVPFPAVLDRFGIVGRRYGATELPLLVVIDRAGIVRWRRAGYFEDTLARLDTLLAGLARDEAGTPPAPDAGRSP